MVSRQLKKAINRRRYMRRSSDAVAVIRFDGGNDVRCILRDISVGGARLQLERPSDLPTYFMLTIPAERIERGCALVWKAGEQIGVRFR
jgi:hypothetical protein